jgi:hypothetical protein
MSLSELLDSVHLENTKCRKWQSCRMAVTRCSIVLTRIRHMEGTQDGKSFCVILPKLFTEFQSRLLSSNISKDGGRRRLQNTGNFLPDSEECRLLGCYAVWLL